MVREFKQRFAKEAGSLTCRGLLGYDLNDPEAVKSVSPEKLPKSYCVGYVRLATVILEEMFEI